MKVNFNKPFVNFKGEPIVENGKEKSIKEVVAASLFEGHFLMRRPNVSGEEKMVAYNLSRKVNDSGGEIVLSVEEAAMIKEAVLPVLNPGGYAQVVSLIEK
jgi:hypothetical protein